MSGTPVRILLARHGETVYNVEGRWQGRDDSPLTERGLAQAVQLAQAVRDEPIAAVYSSHQGRAVATADEVARLHGLTVTPDPRLGVIHVGAWTGLLNTEIRARYPELMALWATRPFEVSLPEGESIAETQARALNFFEERMPEHAGQMVVVITHGTVGQCILVHGLGRRLEDLWLEPRLDNCQISRLEWTARDGLRVTELVDVRHLAEVGTLKRWRVVDPDPDSTPKSEDAA